MIRYIELDGKVPKHTFNEFATTHEHFKDAGIILNNKVVVVDFDQAVSVAEQIYKEHPTLSVRTTRGIHLYYKRPKGLVIKSWTGKLTVSGVTADFKTGPRAMGTIKQNGKLRKMTNEQHLQNFDSLPELPAILYPSKLKESLYQLTDGQGRNSALYTHLLTTKEMYPETDIQDLAEFINQYVFQDPLAPSELATLIDSVGSKEINNKDNKWLNPKDTVMTSEVLVKKLDIKYYQQKLYFKQGDRYICDPKNNYLLREIDKHIQLKPSQHNDLLKLFEIKADRVETNDFPIQLRNGYILDGEDVLKVNVGFTPYFLDVRYDDQAYDENVDKFLDFLSNSRKDLRNVVEEMLGHMLMTKGFPHKVFFLQGSSGENGKSTVIKMVKNFMQELSTLLPLQKFDDDTSVFSLVGKLVNIGDDIDASYLDKSSNFKTLASGDPIMVRPIYAAPVKVENKSTLIFTCNEMPTFKDKSGGVLRRIVVIPCDNRVKKRDNDIDEKLSSESAKSYILKLAIEGIKRIKQNGGKLSNSITIEAKTKEYFVATDSVLSFESENKTLILNKETKDVYRAYVAFCMQHGLKEVGNTEFGRRLKSIGYESKQKWVNKVNRRYYVKDDEILTDVLQDGVHTSVRDVNP